MDTFTTGASQSKRNITPDSSLQQLKIFEGNWNIEGENFESEVSHYSKVSGNVSYEWLEGNYFMICRWDRKFESDEHIGIGVMGYDELKHSLTSNNYDNLGYMRRYKITVSDNTFEFIGENERGIIEFSDDGKSFTENWEASVNISEWIPICSLTANKN